MYIWIIIPWTYNLNIENEDEFHVPKRVSSRKEIIKLVFCYQKISFVKNRQFPLITKIILSYLYV